MCESYPKCLGEPLVYHCVRSTESLVEVCAPNGPIVGLYVSLSTDLSIYLSIYHLSFSNNFYAISYFLLIVTKYSSLVKKKNANKKHIDFIQYFFPLDVVILSQNNFKFSYSYIHLYNILLYIYTCTFNIKVILIKLHKNVYVPPFFSELIYASLLIQKKMFAIGTAMP